MPGETASECLRLLRLTPRVDSVDSSRLASVFLSPLAIGVSLLPHRFKKRETICGHLISYLRLNQPDRTQTKPGTIFGRKEGPIVSDCWHQTAGTRCSALFVSAILWSGGASAATRGIAISNDPPRLARGRIILKSRRGSRSRAATTATPFVVASRPALNRNRQLGQSMANVRSSRHVREFSCSFDSFSSSPFRPPLRCQTRASRIASFRARHEYSPPFLRTTLFLPLDADRATDFDNYRFDRATKRRGRPRKGSNLGGVRGWAV